MAGYFSGNGTYIEIADNAALDLPVGGWSLQFFVYPDSSLTQNSFGYIYSHAQPLTNVSAINIIRTSPGKAFRIIVDFNGGNLLDHTSTSIFFTDNVWNTLVVSYNGTNIFVGIGQGPGSSVVSEIISPPSLGTIAPAGVARLGTSVQGGTRNWAGRIAQAFKADIALTLTEVQRLAGQYQTPGFFPFTSAWQIPMWNAPSFDVRGMLSVTDVSMSYAADGAWILPQETGRFDEFTAAAVTQKIFQYFRYG
jgi:hypothetical protein